MSERYQREMESPNPLELSLSLKPTYFPKTITSLLKDLRNMNNALEKLSVLDESLEMHKKELARVVAFKRELPQSALLLMECEYSDFVQEKVWPFMGGNFFLLF